MFRGIKDVGGFKWLGVQGRVCTTSSGSGIANAKPYTLNP